MIKACAYMLAIWISVEVDDYEKIDDSVTYVSEKLQSLAEAILQAKWLRTGMLSAKFNKAPANYDFSPLAAVPSPDRAASTDDGFATRPMVASSIRELATWIAVEAGHVANESDGYHIGDEAMKVASMHMKIVEDYLKDDFLRYLKTTTKSEAVAVP
jgi:hypothetical protein